MNVRFADTAYYIALLNQSDEGHQSAMDVTRSFAGKTVTTSAVLQELGNYLAQPEANRELFVNIVRELRLDPTVEIVHVDQRLWEAGLGLFAARPDKKWSITDCISFVVMNELTIEDALTTDHHFEQAGFRLLLRV